MQSKIDLLKTSFESIIKTFFPLSQEWHSDQNGQTGNNNGKNGNICMSPDKQNRGTKEMKG